MSTVSNESQQGGNPVEGMEAQGNAEFDALINGQENAQSPGQAQTGAAKPRSALPQKTADQIDAERQVASPTGAGAANVAPVAARAPVPVADHGALIRDTVAATAAAFQQTQRQQPPPQRQFTQQEQEQQFNERYRVVRVTPEHIKRIFDQDPNKGAAALNDIIQGSVTQALLMAKELGEAGLNNVRSSYDPKIKSYDEYMARVQEDKIESDFYKTNADLADERDLVETVKSDLINRVRSGQLKFPDQASANKAVAEATRKIVARMNKPVTSGAEAQGQRPAGNSPAARPAVRQMSGASSPGRSGTGKATAPSDVDLVFGSDAR